MGGSWVVHHAGLVVGQTLTQRRTGLAILSQRSPTPNFISRKVCLSNQHYFHKCFVCLISSTVNLIIMSMPCTSVYNWHTGLRVRSLDLTSLRRMLLECIFKFLSFSAPLHVTTCAIVDMEWCILRPPVLHLCMFWFWFWCRVAAWRPIVHHCGSFWHSMMALWSIIVHHCGSSCHSLVASQDN